MRDCSTWLLAALVSTTVTFCVACGARPDVSPDRPPPDAAGIAEAEQRAVAVYVHCLPPLAGHAGSGVAIMGRSVVTALHVVNCAPLNVKGAQVADVYIAPAAVIIQDANDETHLAEVRLVDVDRDMVRLELDADWSHEKPTARLAPPPRIGRVCLAASVPKREVKCGEVRRLRSWPPDMVLYTGVQVTFGNSGGGVYDDEGRLVGIETRCDDSAGCVLPGAYGPAIWDVRASLVSP